MLHRVCQCALISASFERIRIHVIEIETKTAAYLRQRLAVNGYTVEVCADGKEGLEQALITENDLIILNVMLPQHDV